MKKSNLEDYIRSNRDEFNLLEPSDAVWERISGSRKERKIFLGAIFFRVAAILTLIIITSALAIQTNFFGIGNKALKNDPELAELIEAEAFFSCQVNGKMDEIRKCYSTYPELKKEIEADLKELETMYNELKSDLKENLANKTVIEAMIQNSRYRLKLVDDVLEQIEC